ncbi:MAG: hypothetical protein WEE89_22085 [Gemmatimonadota bacterium]
MLAERNQVRFYSAHDAMLRYLRRGELPIFRDNGFHYPPIGQLLWSSAFAECWIG